MVHAADGFNYCSPQNQGPFHEMRKEPAWGTLLSHHATDRESQCCWRPTVMSHSIFGRH